MMPSIVSFYAAVLGLMLIILSLRVIGVRRVTRTSLGYASSSDLERRVRVQGNFAEYVPITLILLAFVEMQAWPYWLVHALGVALLLGRIVHAFGVSQSNEDYRLRVTGMAVTFTVLGTASMLLIASPLLR